MPNHCSNRGLLTNEVQPNTTVQLATVFHLTYLGLQLFSLYYCFSDVQIWAAAFPGTSRLGM